MYAGDMSAPITTAAHRIWVDELGILRLEVLPGGEVDLREAEAAMAASVALAQGRPLPVLVDLRQLRRITREARIYMGSSEEGRAIIAAFAFVVSSSLTRTFANFFLHLNRFRQPFPVKIHGDVEHARAWLIAAVG